MFSEDDLIIRKLDLSRGFRWENGKPGPCRLGFFFPQQGRGVYSNGQGKQLFAAGDVLVLNMSIAGRVDRLGRKKLKIAFFAAFLEQLAGVFPLTYFRVHQEAFKNTPARLFFPAATTFASKCHHLLNSAPLPQDVEHRCHVLRIVAQVFAEQYEAIRAEWPARIRTRGAKVDSAKGLSLEQIEDSTSEELARKFGYSQRHLNRLIHASFGLSFSALKMEMRLLKAAALLRNGGTKIVSVAADCGFNHVNLFSSRFKKRFGTSPSQWRKGLIGAGPKNLYHVANGACLLHLRGLCPFPLVQGQTAPVTERTDSVLQENAGRGKPANQPPATAKGVLCFTPDENSESMMKSP